MSDEKEKGKYDLPKKKGIREMKGGDWPEGCLLNDDDCHRYCTHHGKCQDISCPYHCLGYKCA